MLSDPFHLRTPAPGIEAAVGTTLADGWFPIVGLNDGRNVGPVQICQPPTMVSGVAGGVAHQHSISPKAPRKGTEVLVVFVPNRPIGVLL